MSSLTIVVLPAPVGPTMATVCPGWTAAEKSWMMILFGSYPKRTWSKVTWPWMDEGGTGLPACCSSSSSARNSKTRSAAAAMDCSILDTCAIWVMGWVKLRTYWINDWISPTWMAPDEARMAPTTVTAT